MPIVREHLDRIAHFHTDRLRQWAGRSFVYTSDGYRWEDQPAPTGGESADWGDWDFRPTYLSDEEWLARATHIEIPATAYGDYAGSSVERSNNRAIRSEYPEHVVEATSTYAFSTLLLALDADVPEDLLDGLEHLLDYPVWDESDWSALEVELEQEAWDHCGRDDFRREIGRLADKTFADLDDVTLVEDYVGELSDEDVNALSYDAAESLDEWPRFVCEDATGGGYWEGWQEWVRAGFLRVLDAVNRSETPDEWKPVPVLDGQESLAVAL